MYRFLLSLIGLAFGLSDMGLRAQQTSPANTASVKGLVRDTVKDLTVKSATVSLFRSDSTLIGYQLTNNYGEFTLKNLQPNSKFYIEVSHLGYELLRQSFTSLAAATPLDLKTLVLIPKDIALGDVTIRIPPISMNGDTLEINPSAFKLDSNAVVEDLLRKIPNVTLWGDGSITVNGKPVKRLLVNGKEFFGGEFKTATQNIPKNVVEKIQVYKERTNEDNSLDSSLAVNIKLKQGKDRGYFGKTAVGYGTDERYEADANLNVFTSKMQLGLIGASNNINKKANSVQTLISNSTFKGVGTTTNYQPDFRVTGVIRSNEAGAMYAYNFFERPTSDHKNVLTANYFLQNITNKEIVNSLTTTSIGAAEIISDQDITNNNTVSTNHAFDSRYQFVKDRLTLNISQNAKLSTGETLNQALRSVADEQNLLTSTNNTLGNDRFNNKSFGFSVNLDKTPYFTSKMGSINARYNVQISDNTSRQSDITEFRSFINPAANRDFNRRYDTEGTDVRQTLSVDLRSLKKLLFGSKRLGGINLGVNNALTLANSAKDRQVSDFNAASGNFGQNAYLSNTIRTSQLEEAPGLRISKTFSRSLTNRFKKSLSLQGLARQRFIFQDNRSDRSFRNISRNYSNFVPAASLSYTYNQFSEFNNDLSLKYDTDVDIPQIDQLAPLTDSTNFYRLQRGNRNLTESLTRSLTLSFLHNALEEKNALSYKVNAAIRFTDDFIADSILIDSQNKRNIYLINADGFSSMQLQGTIWKALRFNSSTLQVNLDGSASMTKRPGYINNTFGFSKNLIAGGNLAVYYQYKDKLAVESKQALVFTRVRQNAFNTSYSCTTVSQDLVAAYQVAKKFTLNSNISFNSNKAAGASAVYYTIWNASAVLRLMKGNNAEIKLSALDLLRQNNSVINYGGANSFTVGTRNVLQQYFMTTISYFPRQFGKRRKGSSVS